MTYPTCPDCGHRAEVHLNGCRVCDCKRLPKIDLVSSAGTCQICGRVTADRYCYASARCKEVGGGDVL